MSGKPQSFTAQDSREQGSRNTPAPKSFSAGDLILECEPWIWSFSEEMHGRACASCFKISDKLSKCARCRLYAYCDRDCQRVHWTAEHKTECKAMKNLCMQWKDSKSKQSGAGDAPNIIRPDHECADFSGGFGSSKPVCDGFGAWTIEIMLLKLYIKIQNSAKVDLPGYDDKTSSEYMELITYDHNYEGLQKEVYQGSHSNLVRLICACLEIPVEDLLVSEEQLADYFKRLHYNACRYVTYDTVPGLLIGAGIFPDARLRNAKRVCSDANVTTAFRGRRLLLLASEDIPRYTGLSDVRWADSDFGRDCLMHTLKQRRKFFEERNGRPCICRKCTDKYDAEVNPLKCSTPGCIERIPSDYRAAEPCPNCGAINTARLEAYQRILARFETETTKAFGVVLPNDELEAHEIMCLDMLDHAGLLQNDAHLRFSVAWNVSCTYVLRGELEKAWKLCLPLLSCIRSVYPKYHFQRALFFLNAGHLLLRWWKEQMNSDRNNGGSEEEAIRVHRVIGEGYQELSACLTESADIFTKFYGENSAMARVVLDMTGLFERTRCFFFLRPSNSADS